MTTIPLSEAKTHLAQLLKDAENLGEGVVITRSGRPSGVLLPVDEYEGLLETLDILADPELAQALKQGLVDIEHGDVVDHETLWNGLEDPVRSLAPPAPFGAWTRRFSAV